mgnify:FL=1
MHSQEAKWVTRKLTAASCWFQLRTPIKTLNFPKVRSTLFKKTGFLRAADNDTDIKYELKSKNDPDGNFEDGAYKYWYLS